MNYFFGEYIIKFGIKKYRTYKRFK